MNTVYEEVKKRLAENGIDTSNKRLFIIRNQAYLDGEEILGYTFSKDGKWLCIPVSCDVGFSELSETRFPFVPKCYEIEQEYETFITVGDMSVRTKIFILND